MRTSLWATTLLILLFLGLWTTFLKLFKDMSIKYQSTSAKLNPWTVDINKFDMKRGLDPDGFAEKWSLRITKEPCDPIVSSSATFTAPQSDEHGSNNKTDRQWKTFPMV
jgi:hypothetical protein